MTVLALIAVLGASAHAAVDPRIVDGLTYLRDAPDGGALWAYLRRDPIPVVFARLPIGIDSRYVRRRGKAWIEVSDRLLREPGPVIGRELYHQYIHRLQDRSPELVTARQAETAHGYAVAMRFLRSQLGGGLPQAPPEVRAAFGVDDNRRRDAELERHQGAILVYTSGR